MKTGSSKDITTTCIEKLHSSKNGIKQKKNHSSLAFSHQ